MVKNAPEAFRYMEPRSHEIYVSIYIALKFGRLFRSQNVYNDNSKYKGLFH